MWAPLWEERHKALTSQQNTVQNHTGEAIREFLHTEDGRLWTHKSDHECNGPPKGAGHVGLVNVGYSAELVGPSLLFHFRWTVTSRP